MGHTSVATIPLALNGTFVAGVSPSMVTLESVVAGIAVTNLPILLTGEIGTGKETFARRIHELSMRRAGPLVRVACASMDASQLPGDAELNGNGNSAQDGGTIFFDEIGELDAACQQKLLCALPDGDAVLRNGCLSPRLIATTSQNLEDAVRAGRFRSELFYRINGICLRLPPLRERKEDIQALAECFLTKHATQLGRPRPTLSARTQEALVNYSWPGNIRELENVVRRIVALNDESLAISELSQSRSSGRSAAAASPNCSLKAAARAASREAERELILKALARTRWNRKRAAQELQISYKSLLYKLKQIGLQDAEAN